MRCSCWRVGKALLGLRWPVGVLRSGCQDLGRKYCRHGRMLLLRLLLLGVHQPALAQKSATQSLGHQACALRCGGYNLVGGC